VEELLSAKEAELKDAAEKPLAENELQLMHAYWRACNYLSVGMIYLKTTRCSKSS
jgi:xylulose-5-phosphate/fructose-6-phosphate phosphoketolase